MPIVQPDRHQRSQRHGEIDRQSVKAHAFSPSLGRDYVYRNRIAGNRGQSHEPALDETNRHDRIDRHRKPITGEQTGEYREGEYI